MIPSRSDSDKPERGEIPRPITKRSLPLHQTLEQLGLSDGLIGVSGTRERVRLFLEPGSALGRALREWTDAADELSIALGSVGFFIATNESPVVLLKSRGPNRD